MRRAAVLVPLLAALAAPSAQAARLLDLQVGNGSTPFLGDGPFLTTVSPNGDGFRDAVHLRFRLTAPAAVSLVVVRTDTAESDPEQTASGIVARVPARRFKAGPGELVWKPSRTTPPRTYLLRLTVAGRTVTHTPVVRVQGIDAGFFKPSYAPGEEAALEVATDARTLTFQVFAYGGGAF